MKKESQIFDLKNQLLAHKAEIEEKAEKIAGCEDQVMKLRVELEEQVEINKIGKKL